MSHEIKPLIPTTLQAQDEEMDLLSEQVARIGQLSLNINEELQEQNVALEELSIGMDQTSYSIDKVNRRTMELVNQVGGPGVFMVILVLSLMALMLFLLIIYT